MTPSPTWMACEHPERPPDEWIAYHFVRCAPCAIAIEAHNANAQVDSLLFRIVNHVNRSGAAQ